MDRKKLVDEAGGVDKLLANEAKTGYCINLCTKSITLIIEYKNSLTHMEKQ